MKAMRGWAITALLLWRAGPALGWGMEGHEIVCEMAWHEMSAQARTMVRGMLKHDPDRGSRTLRGACTWADRQRGDADFNWSAPQHYVNIAPGTAFDAAANCGPEGCVLRAIGQTARLVADSHAPAHERRQALKLLAHFVGDIHQPLHVSYPKDHGGNTIPVTVCDPGCTAAHTCFRTCDTLTLHKVWDEQIIGSHHQADSVALARQLRTGISDQQRQAWRVLDIQTWTGESFTGSEEIAYHPVRDGKVAPGYLGDVATPEAPAKLAPDYDAVMRPIVDEQLRKAAVRLAAVLDALADSQVPAGLTTVAPWYVTPSNAAHSKVVVRQRPTAQSARIGQLGSGERAELIGIEQAAENSPVWYRVRFANGTEGFVKKRLAVLTR